MLGPDYCTVVGLCLMVRDKIHSNNEKNRPLIRKRCLDTLHIMALLTSVYFYFIINRGKPAGSASIWYDNRFCICKVILQQCIQDGWRKLMRLFDLNII